MTIQTMGKRIQFQTFRMNGLSQTDDLNFERPTQRGESNHMLSF